MKRQWTNEELIADFTISAKELDLIGDSKTDHNLLGAACLLGSPYYSGENLR
jgi:hypothetical protein